MSEELTKEGLDELEKLLRGACGGPLKPFVPELRHLLSMARRTLEAEERLEKAVEAIEDAMMHLRTNTDIDGNKMDQSDAFCSLDRFLSEYLGGPEALHPPAQCAPPEGTDVPPLQMQTCKHGTPFRYHCDECDADEEKFGDGDPSEYGDR